MNKLTLADLQVAGKRVLVRVDFNVPLRSGEVSDDARIQASIPTIRTLIDQGARVVLMSHLGRPRGTTDPRYTLAPVARLLADLLGRDVRFVGECVGPAAIQASERLQDGEVLLLENLRFHPEEEANDEGFATQLSELGDLYVNDAFGAAHRAHASISGVAAHFHQAAAGLLLEKELRYLGEALKNATRPYVAILGGAKISGKIDLIENLLTRVDTILIGGGMTYTFYRALGVSIGDSLLESDRVAMAKETLASAREKGVEIVLPVDSMVSTAADGSEPAQATEGQEIAEGYLGVDIGPRTIELFQRKLVGAQTVVWNGPLGIFEVPAFAEGTLALARGVADAARAGATTIVGGGDSVAAIGRSGIPMDTFSHISTGGGAFLEFLEGQELPGVAALTDRS